MNKTLGIVGVRGYVGRELLQLLSGHPSIQVEWVSSRELKGQSLSYFLSESEHITPIELDSDHYFNKLNIETLSDDDVAQRKTDIIVLALPNGLAKSYVEKITKEGNCQIVIDLSADYRFDKSWSYSVPELNSEANLENIKSNELIKISNPGCYATAMQIALAPLVNHIQGSANCFGISGFSGAGTNPSPNNNEENLKDNILPYGLVDHIHEKEVAFQLGIPINFSPHVAQFFRGISMTVQIELKESWSINSINELFEQFYKGCSLINVEKNIPNIQKVVNTNGSSVGGFTLSENGKRLTLVCCLDNLLKGAASQAIQNIELYLKKIAQ